MPSSQNSTGPSPCQEWLDLPGEGHPGSPGLSFFSWTQFPCPLLRCQSGQRLHLSPSCCPAAPAPAVEGGAQSVSPRRGTEGEEVVCVCVCYRGQNTALSGSQRVLSLGVRHGGQRKKIQAVFQQRQQQRRRRPSRASFVSRVSR